MLIEEPYFLENDEWYFFDEKKWKYKLTEKGKKDENVVKSYKNFYRSEISKGIKTES